MVILHKLLLYCLFCTFLSACASSHDNLNSTLWMQTAVEYRAATQPIYRTAESALRSALLNKRWTAALEQTDDYEHLPPAVILDIDETTLDNSPFQAQLIATGDGFSSAAWDQWVAKAEAEPVAGALSFAEAAKNLGIHVIYVTNRTCGRRRDNAAACPQEKDTIRNLISAGFPEIDPAKEMLLQNERSGWSEEKQSRRRFVARHYRLLMLIGDDLGDFIPHVKKGITPQQRAQKADLYKGYWGKKWFMLPNPAYGSWLRILHPPKTQYLEGYQ